MTFIDLVGLSGAGKTTTRDILSQCEPQFLDRLPIARISLAWYASNNAALFGPAFLTQHQHDRWFTWRETKWMAHLCAGEAVLRGDAGVAGRVCALGEGTIEKLTLLREYGPAIRDSDVFHRWWVRQVSTWSEQIKLVVWLDAPDQILLQRVRQREKEVPVKRRSDTEAQAMFDRQRRRFEDIVGRMTANGRGPAVLRFDSSRTEPEEIADAVLAVLDRSRHASRIC